MLRIVYCLVSFQDLKVTSNRGRRDSHKLGRLTSPSEPAFPCTFTSSIPSATHTGLLPFKLRFQF